MNKRIGFSGRSKLAMLVAGLMVISVVGVALAADVPYVFDHFDTLPQSLTVIYNGALQATDSVGTGAAGILGGERDIVLNMTNLTGQIDVLTNDAVLYLTEFAYIASPNALGDATIKWDGENNDPLTLDPVGLRAGGGTGVDITQSGLYTGINLVVTSDDNPADIVLTVYTDGTNFSTYTINLPGGINSPTGYFIPFGSFAGTADFTNVGAVVFYLNATDVASSGLDFVMHMVESNGYDLGDLPVAYGITLGDPLGEDGARHVVGPLFLGTEIDIDADGNPSADAMGDDTSGNVPADEDGVQRVNLPWSNGTNGGAVSVNVTGGRGCLTGWIDFNRNDAFVTAERVITRVPVNSATNPTIIQFNIPAGTFNGVDALPLNARFRLVPDRFNDGNCTAAYETIPALTGEIYNGEVEDYQWGFGPTAVTLNSLEATADAQNNTAVLILAASVVAALGLAGVVMARRRTA